MICTAQIFLSGFCTLSTAVHLDSFDSLRFGGVTETQQTVSISRIDQAFQEDMPVLSSLSVPALAYQMQPPEIRFPIAKPNPKPVVTASLAVPTDSAAPGTELKVTPPPAPKKENKLFSRKSKKSKKFTRDRKSTLHRSTREKVVFWPFKKKPKLPEGINLKSTGYKEVHKAALKHGVDVEFALRVAKQESRGNCNATSSANAKGVMQVIPGTALKYGIRRSNNLYNCKIGADVGVRELKSCLQKAGGNKVQALVCYNAGPGWITSNKYRGRRIPAETRKYIKIITGKSVAKVT